MRIGNLIRWAVAIAFVGVSLMNASWMAPEPAGAMAMIGSHSEDNGDCATLEGTRRAVIDAGGPVVINANAKPVCMPAATALTQLPRYHFILNMEDGAKALAVFDGLKRPIDERYGLMGDAASVAVVRAREPKAWAFTVDEGRACFNDYVKLGWVGIVPSSCAGKTITVPIDQKWKIAGWPKRFQARMAAAGTRVILTGPDSGSGALTGLTKLEQIPEIPRDYAGFVWVDDIALIGPAVRR
jgi:hypothetical protein